MSTYQLSCGCWVSDREHFEIMAPYPCRKCDTLRTVVIGWTRPPEFA